MAKKHTTKVSKHIVKRQGHKEKYDHRKVYASAYSACLSAHVEDQTAELIADKVCKSVDKWVSAKTEVKSYAIHKLIVKELKKFDKNAAFMYDNHRDIS